MTTEEFVDASTFMGMHSADDVERSSCLRFFAGRLDGSLGMAAEQVGACDDLVWQYGRQQQDDYYPFMDNLHSRLRFHRLHYAEADLVAALHHDYPGLPVTDRLTLSMVVNHRAVLYTLNPRLLALTHSQVRHPADGAAPDAELPGWLAELYERSLALRVPATASLVA